MSSLRDEYKIGDVVRSIRNGMNVPAGVYGVITVLEDPYARCYWPLNRCNSATPEPVYGFGLSYLSMELVPSQPADNIDVGDTVIHVPMGSTLEQLDWVGQTGEVVACIKNVEAPAYDHVTVAFNVPGQDKPYEVTVGRQWLRHLHHIPNEGKPKMAERRFKVGDRVKRTDGAYGDFVKGTTGVVADLCSGTGIKVKRDDNCPDDWSRKTYDERGFVLVEEENAPAYKFQIGDRVRRIGLLHGYFNKGDIGIVREYINHEMMKVQPEGRNVDWQQYAYEQDLFELVEKTAKSVALKQTWPIGTALKTIEMSFGCHKGQIGAVVEYDAMDNTYKLQRPNNGRCFWAKAECCVLVPPGENPFSHVVNAVHDSSVSPTPSTPIPTTEGNIMSLKFETKHYINGNNVNDYTPSDLVSLIAREEAEIAKLKDVKSMPKRVKAEIAKREKAIKDLVEFLDAQDDAAAAATPSAV